MDDSEDLIRAADAYRQAIQHVEQAKAAQLDASNNLAAAMRMAYANGTKKADILRATGHIWSRTWLDNALKSDD